MTLAQFKQHVLPLKNKLYRFALSFLKVKVEAEDVVQDVMIKCWETIKDLKEIEDIEAYCMIMTRHKSLDKLKKKGRHYQDVTEMYQLKAYVKSPQDTVIQSERVAYIMACIDELSEIQRSILLLRDVEGYSYTEVSKILEIPMEQVKVYLFRGRKKIKEKMSKIENYGT